VRWVGPYAARGADGAPAVTREYATDAYNYPAQSWYAEAVPVGADRATRITAPLKTTAPYVDALAGQPTVFQSVVHAIHSADGRVLGVVSVDSTGSSIDTVLGSYHPTPSSSAFLVDDRGVVVFPRSGAQLLARTTVPFADRLPWDTLTAEGATTVVNGLQGDGHTFEIHMARVRGNAILCVMLATDEAYAVLDDVRATGMLAGVLTLLAVAVLVAFVVRRLLQPLSSITSAAQRVAAGDMSVVVESNTSDEIGTLGRAFGNMVQQVKARDAALKQHAEELELTVQARTASLRLILDSTGDALLPVATDGRVQPGTSTITKEWFGDVRTGDRVWDYLYGDHRTEGIAFEVAFAQMAEDFLPFELLADQMPSRLQRHGHEYKMEFKRVGGTTLESVLIVVRDVTKQVQAEEREAEFREIHQAMMVMNRDRAGFRKGLREIDRLLEELERGWSDTPEFRRTLHTKGSAAVLGFTSVATACHAIEDHLVDDSERVTPQAFTRVRDIWRKMLANIEQFLGDDAGIRIEADDYNSLLKHIRARTDHGELFLLVRSFQDEPTRGPLHRLASQASRVAQQLGKEVRVEVEDHGLRLPANRCDDVWTTAVHIVRNAIDHGLETAADRVEHGKPAAGTMTLSTTIADNTLVIGFSDDGRGIDWQTVRTKARARGLPATSHDDLVEALFSDGLSTRDEVSEFSGRGVGLSAVKAAVEGLGGKVVVFSSPGRGTNVELHVPLVSLLAVNDLAA
jgi:HAMP domain-containing protein/HPt (histidine-containing phosphotransfer) domain-containing protein